MTEFRIIPAIDLLDGQVVRLFQGDFDQVRRYGDPMAAIERWQIPMGETLHLVDLEASRQGKPTEISVVGKLARLGYDTQVGGGVRTVDDAKLWFDAGANRVVIGTLAAESPARLRQLTDEVGADRILPAVDVMNGIVRVAGWESTSSRSVPMVMETLRDTGFEQVLVTDISRDGTLLGPSFDLYRELEEMTGLRIIASGGVGTLNDVASLSRLRNVSGVIVGRALHDRTFSWAEAKARVEDASPRQTRLLTRIVVRDGRVDQAMEVAEARDPGDVVEIAKRLEGEGADGIYFENGSADSQGGKASIQAIVAAASQVRIPTAAGGRIEGVADVRELIERGISRVLLGDLALETQDALHACAAEFGPETLVGQVRARRSGSLGYRVVRERDDSDTAHEVTEWASRLEALGVGELVVSACGEGAELSGVVRKISGSVRIPVVARPERPANREIRRLIESGGASGVLFDSRVPEREMTIPEVKRFLTTAGIPVRGGRA